MFFLTNIFFCIKTWLNESIYLPSMSGCWGKHRMDVEESSQNSFSIKFFNIILFNLLSLSLSLFPLSFPHETLISSRASLPDYWFPYWLSDWFQTERWWETISTGIFYFPGYIIFYSFSRSCQFREIDVSYFALFSDLICLPLRESASYWQLPLLNFIRTFWAKFRNIWFHYTLNVR